MAELAEFSRIVDGEWNEAPPNVAPPSSEELTLALQVMLTRQIIYSWTPGIGGVYEIVRNHVSFFDRYFGALGYRVHVSTRDQMVALQVPPGESRYDSVYERLRKDETIVLLALRLMWEEAVANKEISDGGIADTTTGELADRITTVTQQPPPSEARLLDILKLFQRHGGVRIGQRDRIERVNPMSILPGVSLLSPDTYVEGLRLWGASPSPAQPANQNDEF
jgi:hypothetical protein